MATVLGIDAKLYYQDPANSTVISDGGRLAWPANAEPPGLTELTNVRSVTLNLETGEADITTRGGNGWRQTVATLKDGTLEFEMVWDTGDAGFTVIKNAWLNKTAIAMVALDGAKGTDGFQGLWADFSITNFTRNEDLEEALTVSVTAKPTRGPNAVAPAWIVTDTTV